MQFNMDMAYCSPRGTHCAKNHECGRYVGNIPEGEENFRNHWMSNFDDFIENGKCKYFIDMEGRDAGDR